jgi:gas vesicle protein
MKTFKKNDMIKYIDEKSSLIEALIKDGWAEVKEFVEEVKEEIEEEIEEIKAKRGRKPKGE